VSLLGRQRSGLCFFCSENEHFLEVCERDRSCVKRSGRVKLDNKIYMEDFEGVQDV